MVESHHRIPSFLACWWDGIYDIITSLAGGNKKDKKMKGHVSWHDVVRRDLRFLSNSQVILPEGIVKCQFAAFDSMSDMTSRISVKHNSCELRMPHNSCISTTKTFALTFALTVPTPGG